MYILLPILKFSKLNINGVSPVLEILDVSQSTLSHHMKILTDAKVVNVRKDGKWSHYSLSSNGIKKIIEYLKNYQA